MVADQIVSTAGFTMMIVGLVSACGNLCVLGDIDDSKIVRMRPPLAQSDSDLQ